MKPKWAVLVACLAGLAGCGGSATQDDGSTGGTTPNGTGGVGAAPARGGAGGDGGTERGGSSAGAGAQGGAALGGADPDGGAGGDPDQGGADPAGGGGGSSGGAAERGGSSGAGAASWGGVAGGGESSGYCAGFEPDPTASDLVRCATHADCPPVMGAPGTQCATEPFTFECGGPAPVRTCEVDEDCAVDAICVEDGCESTWCLLGCPDAPCSATQDCVDKRCVERQCDAEGAAPCPDRHSCLLEDPDADARGCVPDACAAGAPCPEGWDCAPGAAADGYGCVHRTCSEAADCDCGACVNGLCAPTPGFCFEYSPPP